LKLVAEAKQRISRSDPCNCADKDKVRDSDPKSYMNSEWPARCTKGMYVQSRVETIPESDARQLVNRRNSNFSQLNVLYGNRAGGPDPG